MGMGGNDPYLRCFRCGETKKKDGNFPVKKSNVSGYRGICFECEPPVVVTAKPAPPKFHPDTIAKMCTGKKKYTSRIHAIGVASKVAKNAPLLRVYHCPICRSYHLTKKEK